MTSMMTIGGGDLTVTNRHMTYPVSYQMQDVNLAAWPHQQQVFCDGIISSEVPLTRHKVPQRSVILTLHPESQRHDQLSDTDSGITLYLNRTVSSLFIFSQTHNNGLLGKSLHRPTASILRTCNVAKIPGHHYEKRNMGSQAKPVYLQII